MLQNLKKLAYTLSFSDRLELANAIIQSLESELDPHAQQKSLLERLTGYAKKVRAPLNEAEVETELDEHFVDRYL